MNSRSCIDEPTRGRNDKDARSAARRPRKGGCVRYFPAKVEAAQEREHFRDWRAFFAAQFSRQLKPRALAQNHSCALPSSVGG